MMPQIYAKFPKITEVPETERYSGRWNEIWRVNMRDEEHKPIPDPQPGEQYRIYDYGFGLVLYQEDKAYVKQKSKEKDCKARLKDRKEQAGTLNMEAFELRSAFVRRFRMNTKALYADFWNEAVNMVMAWIAFTSGVGCYHAGWDQFTIREMLAIPYEQDRDKDETMAHELSRRGVNMASFVLAWALCGGITGNVRKEDGWCNTYAGAWKPCEDLDDQYRLLTGLGYEMSDFEKSLQDKSHEFFKRDEEGAD